MKEPGGLAKATIIENLFMDIRFWDFVKMRGECVVGPLIEGFSFLCTDFAGYGGLNTNYIKV